MGIYSIKPKFKEFLRPSLGILKGFHPDFLTWSALVLSLISGILFYFSRRQPVLFLVIPVLLFVRLALNALDGMLAQETGRARPAGEILNEFSDRVSDLFIIWGIIFSSLCNIYLGIVTVPCILLVSYTGILGKAVGVARQYGGIMGKADRVIYIMIASILQFLLSVRSIKLFYNLSIFDWLMLWICLGCILTIISRINSILLELNKK